MFDIGDRIVVIDGPQFTRGMFGTVIDFLQDEIEVMIDARFNLHSYSRRRFVRTDLRLLSSDEMESEMIANKLDKVQEEISSCGRICCSVDCKKRPTTRLRVCLMELISFDISVCDDCFVDFYALYEADPTKQNIKIDFTPEKI
jgi:hypothetical protein